MNRITNILLIVFIFLGGSSVLAQEVTTYAGTGVSGYSGDNGLAIDAEISSPYGIVADIDGNIFFSDQSNGAIRRIDHSTKVITTVVNGDHQGASIIPNELSIEGDFIYFIDNNGATGNILKFSVDNNNVVLVTTLADNYTGICVKGDSIFLSKVISNSIDLFQISTGFLTNFSGVPGTSGITDGPISTALLNSPAAMIIDYEGNLIVAQFIGGVRKIDLTTFSVSTLVSGINGIEGIAEASNGEIYMSIQTSHEIKKITTTGVVELVAGTGTAGSFDGVAGVATFNAPVKIAIDHENNIYISDIDNFKIRHIGCGYANLVDIKSSTNSEVFCSNSSDEWYIYVDPITTQLNENENWIWYSGDCGAEQLFIGDTLVVKPTETTSYYVRGEGGCIQLGECQEITLVEFECDTAIINNDIATAFSPNDDNVNDLFIINGIDSYLQNKVYIYNRWGDLVFDISNYNNSQNVWDGTNKYTGLKAAPGTYFYVIEANGLSVRSSWIQLIK